ncbi:uncharacterized protein IUM83_10246 [Phytophthora cinnamomi]|uniref:uncharacterized protein n=1 Tax=Phytophthora cinnamomi TaxID=4785 RepID=UPI003559CB9B|nr:hypothetical protein IUM83_10246 [Phytophthora cinnamomi]
MGGSSARFSTHYWIEIRTAPYERKKSPRASSFTSSSYTGMTPPSDDGKPAADAAAPKSGGDLAQQQQALITQQLQQQQALLTQQLQQLQNMQNLNPSDLAVLQQQQLALLMMPMFPLMMPLQQQALAAASTGASDSSATASEEAAAEAAAVSEEAAATEAAGDDAASPTYQPATAESLGLTPPFVGTDGFGMLAGTGALNIDDVPKRKRGRPPKKDVAARAKAEAEKTLKQQFPMWGYGLPMPLLPGFPGMLPGMGNPGAVVKDHSAGVDEHVKEEDVSGERPAKMAKKKQRGTGKPRGRPRTRPRPGEIIRRVKPLPIAPANYSVMYNYSLSNLAQKSAELNADGTAADAESTTVTEEAQDENRLAPLSASLLSGEHE